MASNAKPLVLDRPIRTGFKLGLGFFIAWTLMGIVLWLGSIVLGGGARGPTGRTRSQPVQLSRARSARRSGRPSSSASAANSAAASTQRTTPEVGPPSPAPALW
jgi:hypothetical protein